MATTRRRRTKQDISQARERLKVRAQIVDQQVAKEKAIDQIKALRAKLRSM